MPGPYPILPKTPTLVSYHSIPQAAQPGLAGGVQPEAWSTQTDFTSHHAHTKFTTKMASKNAPLKQVKITSFLPSRQPPAPQATAGHHTTRPKVASPVLTGEVPPVMVNATNTKFTTEMAQNAFFEPQTPPHAQAQGGGRDSSEEVEPGEGVQPPPAPAPATCNPTQLVPPPTPSQQQDST